jgi:hypothetical protein
MGPSELTATGPPRGMDVQGNTFPIGFHFPKLTKELLFLLPTNPWLSGNHLHAPIRFGSHTYALWSLARYVVYVPS